MAEVDDEEEYEMTEEELEEIDERYKEVIINRYFHNILQSIICFTIFYSFSLFIMNFHLSFIFLMIFH